MNKIYHIAKESMNINKKILILYCMLMSGLAGFAMIDKDELFSYPSRDYIECSVDVPSERCFKSGTVIRVSYEDDCTYEMRGAFEYACKIWVENVPPTLPLNVEVRLEAFDDNDAISKAIISRPDIQNRFDPMHSSVSSRIKGVLLMEHDNNASVQFIDNLPESFYTSTDMTLIFNRNRLDEISFSLDAVPVDKYDFVTLVLSDLSRLFGIYNAVSADNESLVWKWETPTHFESKVRSIVNDGDEGYRLATSGAVPIRFCGNEVSLFAPSKWLQDVSLNCFIAADNVKLTYLLSDRIGKGSMFRDITNGGDFIMFREDLGWCEVPSRSSMSRNQVNVNIQGNNRVKFDGRLTVGTVPGYRYSSAVRYPIDMAMDVEPVDGKNLVAYESDALRSSVIPYGLLYDSTKDADIHNGWTVSLLKKDGSWDCVYTSDFSPVLSVGVDELQFHFPMSEYERSYGGELRCRVVNAQRCENGGHYIYVSYYVIETLPQKVDMLFSRVVPGSVFYEYLRDVEIGIKNLEGTESLYVEQWIEGDTYPQLYEITDFKKGYFTVTVDKEYYSEFRVTAYNKNGSTKSEIYHMEPLEPADFEYSVSIGDNAIELAQPEGRRASRGKTVPYQIFPIDVIDACVTLDGQVTIGESSIDISSLDRGLYGIRYTDAHGEWRSIKFMKK